MKRSEINAVVKEAKKAFARHGWALPPRPRWDVTDFGLGDFARCGLVLINLTEQKEYCEKLMYVQRGQVTPMHYHASKKEDIICRWGRLILQFPKTRKAFRLQVNGEARVLPSNKFLVLKSGERITMPARVPHAFWAGSRYAVVGEVSTANDDKRDNFFADKRVGRFSSIVEDERPLVRLVGE